MYKLRWIVSVEPAEGGILSQIQPIVYGKGDTPADAVNDIVSQIEKHRDEILGAAQLVRDLTKKEKTDEKPPSNGLVRIGSFYLTRL